MTIRCLDVHARYGCRHAGACCTAGWPIPIEADRLALLRAATDDGRLSSPRASSVLWMTPADAPADTPARLHVDADGCVFFDAGHGRVCRIHGALGHEALPLACRQFPRISVIDPRGTSVTLSHFCPTAAGLLGEAHGITITTDAPAFPAGSELSGLDVRSSLPPLLRPEMLMDWDAWWEWERRSVELLGGFGGSAGDCLARLALAVEDVREWTPRDGPLLSRIDRAFGRTVTGATPARVDADHRLQEVLATIPAELRPATLERPGHPNDEVVRQFLGAHAFANWTAHLGHGLRSWLRSVDTAWSLVDLGLGVRQADLLLRHLADPHALAETFSRAERD